MKTITAIELENMIRRDDDVLIINVLPKEYYDKRHIPSSINIPLKNNEKFIEDVQAHAGSKEKTIIVYCANTSCDLSEKAYDKLVDAGFKNVADYPAGTEGWFDIEHEAA